MEDWNAAIERNLVALKRVLAPLFAMMGGGKTLPRHLHRFVLGLLLPAESAARRLVIAAARGMVAEVPPLQPCEPRPESIELWLRRLGIALTPPHADFQCAEAALKTAAFGAARPRVLSLPLFDPLERPFGGLHRYAPADAAPRIPSLDFDARLLPQPPPPSPDDPLSTARLMLRLDALTRALDDLPAQARRFARWKARRDEALARSEQEGVDVQDKGPDATVAQAGQGGGAGARGKAACGTIRSCRISPLKTRRPPGWWRNPVHEVHAALNAVHELALSAPKAPDTS
ncbi:hypothetical protein [Mesorhizobium sp. IMUNJ 23232]|uniref:hypothetical protein n=1 Tax=Mesorhizobium sp. IMUNJ 23232 TaxID=3376064 RepID=UPI0037A0F708